VQFLIASGEHIILPCTVTSVFCEDAVDIRDVMKYLVPYYRGRLNPATPIKERERTHLMYLHF